MSAMPSLLEIALSCPFLILASIALAAVVILLVVGRKSFPHPVWAVLWMMLAVLILYFALIVWLTVGFGGNSGKTPDPMPYPPTPSP